MITEGVQVNADVYKMVSNGKIGANDGNGKVKVLIAHYDPFVLEGNYKSDLQGI
jgi:hypothetical protein